MVIILGICFFSIICYIITLVFPSTRHSTFRAFCAEQLEGGEVGTDCNAEDDELTKANPDIVEEHCNRIILGLEAKDRIIKALPYIMKRALAENYCNSDRIRIRDTLRGVYFHVKYEGTVQKYLLQCIQDLSANS